MPSTNPPVYLPDPKGVAPPPGSVFSHAVIAGDVVYTSGQNGIDPDGVLLDGFDAQAEQAFENLQVVLRAAGTELSDVIKIRVLLVEASDVHGYTRLRRKYLPQRPGSSLYAVKELAMPGLLVELDAIAIRSNS